MDQNAKKQAVAKAAIEYVEADSIVGVGTGSTVNFFIEELGKIKHKMGISWTLSNAALVLAFLALTFTLIFTWWAGCVGLG